MVADWGTYGMGSINMVLNSPSFFMLQPAKAETTDPVHSRMPDSTRLAPMLYVVHSSV